MPAEIRSQRTFWHIAWGVATGDASLAIVLFALALCWTLLLFLPQAPSDPLTMGRWAVQVEARFGSLSAPLRSLGFFSLLHSPLYYALLSALAFLLLVRTVAWVERLWVGRRVGRGAGEWSPVDGEGLEEMARWLARRGYRTRRTAKGHVLQADRWPWAELMAVMVHVGPLLLLVGLWVGGLRGWRVEGLIGEVGKRVGVPGGGTIGLVETPAGWVSDRPGVRLYVAGVGPEIAVSAVDLEGDMLGLQQAAGEPLFSTLQFRLTEREPDAYFAIPEAGLVVRIAPEPEAALQPGMSLRVQVFRSPSGNLVWEESIQGEAVGIAVEGVRIRIEHGTYPVLSAVYDPGRWLKMMALVVTGLAMLGWGFWPVRRLWLRIDQGQPVGTGDLPRAWGDGGTVGMEIARATAGVASALVAGMALWSLTRCGALWCGSVLPMVLTVLTTMGVGGYLILSARKGGNG
ncbi:MAG TPA: hypothetical protein EYH27_04150 [Anaerolineales bacterium]|nr:hypothetical protein [Anaerolineales bacterium]